MTSSTSRTASAALSHACTRMLFSAPDGPLAESAKSRSKARMSHPADARSAPRVCPTSPNPISAMRENRSPTDALVLGRSVDIFEPLLCQLRAHVVDIEAEFAPCITHSALSLLVFALAACVQDIGGLTPANHHDAVIVGNDQVPRVDQLSGADQWQIHIADRFLDRALREDRPRPNGKPHLGNFGNIAAPRFQDESGNTASFQLCCDQLAEIAVLAR